MGAGQPGGGSPAKAAEPAGGKKSRNRKKNKGTKLDATQLGYSVDSTRMNAGEMYTDN